VPFISVNAAVRLLAEPVPEAAWAELAAG